MPQTSLTAWLSKPAAVRTPVSHLSRDKAKDAGINNPKGTTAEAKQDESPVDIRTEAARPHVIDVKANNAPFPANVEFRACTKDDIPHLKRLNSLLLPVPYPESFYREIIEDPLTNNITLVAVWHDDPRAIGREKGRLVGAIRCRIFAHPPSSSLITPARKDGPMLYLSTLVLLSPYRSYGIASRMLDVMTKRAIRDHGITTVGAHVWVANEEGMEWYRKREFREVGRESGYYRRLRPSDAVVMQRDIGVMDLLDA